MLRTLKSNSPFGAPRDDNARAGCGNRAKSNFLPMEFPTNLTGRVKSPIHEESWRPALTLEPEGTPRTSSHAHPWMADTFFLHRFRYAAR